MKLKKLREKINLTDFEIIKLLNSRLELVLKLKKLKEGVTDIKREKEVLYNVEKLSYGLVCPKFGKKLFSEIIKESKKLQGKQLKLIGFQGEHGAYSELAAMNFDANSVYIPFSEFNEIFEEVENGNLDLGIVAVENSLGGAVAPVNELLIKTKLKAIAEIKLKIHHCLLALPGTDHRDTRIVYSHPQALTQCGKFLSRNKLEPKAFYDTAGAAKMLAFERPEASAAIANKLCGKLYNLEIIKEGIEDNESNITRFLILAREESRKECNKCSIIFSTPHSAGTLFRVLKIFAEADINLTRIESVPIISESIEYAFFLDFKGSNRDRRVIEAFEKVKDATTMFKFLGCYKEGEVLE